MTTKPATKPSVFRPRTLDLSNPEVQRDILWDNYTVDPHTKFGMLFMGRLLTEGAMYKLKRIIFSIPRERRGKVIQRWCKHTKNILAAQQAGKESASKEKLQQTAYLFTLPEGAKEEGDKRLIKDITLLRRIYQDPEGSFNYPYSFSPMFVTNLLNL